MPRGVLGDNIRDTPIAVLDFETTGLTPGYDRVIEVCVARRDPGQAPRLVLDTLVNPLRPVAATEIHGITDEDVAQAPRFPEIAGDLLETLAGCVVCAYNVYFDMKFLLSELGSIGIHCEPPHFCLMYMRPMLRLGKRCNLGDACRAHQIKYEAAHVAASDVQASAQLLDVYLAALEDRGVETFKDLARLKGYKFTRSFKKDPLGGATTYGLSPSGKSLSRNVAAPAKPADDARDNIREYWELLRAAVADLQVTDEEAASFAQEGRRLNLPKETMRVLHARVLSGVIAQFVDDNRFTDQEVIKLRKLYKCLSRLGWAPGE